MNISIRRAEYKDIESMRELYREEAGCQIIHDSMLRRGLADAYLIEINGSTTGYGGVFNKHYPGRIMEFYTLPHVRQHNMRLFRELIAAGNAVEAEAQTNMPQMLMMLYDCATEISVENILFEDAIITALKCQGDEFRKAADGDGKDANEWVLDVGGDLVASGGVLFHYNPPYGDVYMEVVEAHRRKGYGSYLVQELKRVCYEGGHRPAGRCNPDNLASRLTLQRAGMLPCGRMLAGKLRLEGETRGGGERES